MIIDELFRVFENDLAFHLSLFDGPDRCIAVLPGTVDHVKENMVIIDGRYPHIIEIHGRLEHIFDGISYENGASSRLLHPYGFNFR